VRDAVTEAAAQAAQLPVGGVHVSSGMPSMGPHSQGQGIAARLPPPGFEPMPLHQQQQPGAPAAAAAAAAAPAPLQAAEADHGMPVEMNEHQLVLAFLSLLPLDPGEALRFSEQSETEVNVKLMPLTWDEHYQFKYGPMQKFMTDRPAVFGWTSEGAFFKYHNSEELVLGKMQEEEAAAAASVAAAVDGSGSQGGAAFMQPGAHHAQQPQGPPSGGWFPAGHHHQQQQQQHGMLHGGPPTGPAAMPVSMAPAVGPHMGGGAMGVSMGMPYYPHHMMPMHSAPAASMPLAAPSMPFHSRDGW
jgi:hypothetical protein